MATLKDRLQDDLRTAMKARDDVRLRTVRMTLTAISNEEVAGKAARQLTDDEETAVVAREAKRRREAADVFTEAGRDELAARELEEHEVLAGYLPQQLTDDELAALVDAAVAEVAATGAEGPGATGQVMKAVMPQVAGRADGKRVSALVRARLSG